MRRRVGSGAGPSRGLRSFEGARGLFGWRSCGIQMVGAGRGLGHDRIFF
jgi:hypothetical protein